MLTLFMDIFNYSKEIFCTAMKFIHYPISIILIAGIVCETELFIHQEIQQGPQPHTHQTYPTNQNIFTKQVESTATSSATNSFL